MRYITWVACGIFAVSSLSVARADEPLLVGSNGGGTAVVPAGVECISAQQRAEVDAIVLFNRASLGLLNAELGPGVTAYRFWPQGGTLGNDIFVTNFVDQGAGTNILDYACDNWSYDGHLGHDVALRSFSEQAVGVPIFAIQDGVVVARQDGQPDMNTVWANQPANYVVLDHGGGHLTYYWHMKRNSVAVNVGQVIRAGQQLGLTASSGISTGPHLHFETRLSGVPYEPFAGPCRAGTSGWLNVPAIDRTTSRLLDFGMTVTDLNSYVGPPVAFPRHSHASFADTTVFYWMSGANLPAGSVVRFTFIRPNGTTSYASPAYAISWSTQFYRWYWMWWSWNIPEMRSIAGTWRVRIFVNDVQHIEAPIEVLATRNATFNRAPASVAVQFDPPNPSVNDVIFARINTSLTLDDPDYDVLRYRYRWLRDGQVVRDIITAGHADAIPRNTATSGSTLICEVTPSDGLLNGVVATRSITFGCDGIDFNRNGVFPEDQDVIDFFFVLAGGTCAACSDIDFNNNSVFPEDQDVIDFFNVLAGGSCS